MQKALASAQSNPGSITSLISQLTNDFTENRHGLQERHQLTGLPGPRRAANGKEQQAQCGEAPEVILPADGAGQWLGSPVLGLSRSGRKSGCRKLNMSFAAPARLSYEQLLIRCPLSQLSSMKARIEVWSVSVLLDVVVPGERRDHQQRQPRAVAAAVLVAAERRALAADARCR